MGCIYSMSDLHGCLAAFTQALELVDFSGDSKLVLLGDYIHGADDAGVVHRIMELQERYGPDRVIALMGNHEEMALDGRWPMDETRDGALRPLGKEEKERYLSWMRRLPRYHTEGNAIFVHAGIDEEAGELWRWGTDDSTFTEKFPAQTGRFHCGDMKIVAGHVGTAVIAGDPDFHDIYFDGESHYYIDGSTLKSGVVPVLKVDTEKDKYYRVTKTGDWLILPYHEEYEG